DALASLGLVAVNTPGVDGWQSPHAIPDLFGIPLQERTVVLAYDSDVLTKPTVQRAIDAIARWLQQKDAAVEVLDWSKLDREDGAPKLGVDDYLADGHTLDDLQALRVPFADWQAEARAHAADDPADQYLAKATGLYRVKTEVHGDSAREVALPLTNFLAQI